MRSPAWSRPRSPDLQDLLLNTLEAQVPVTVEYPDRVGERPTLGYFQVDLEGADSDDASLDESLRVTFNDGSGAARQTLGRDSYRRGDCNADGIVDITDAVHLLLYMTGQGVTMTCRAVGGYRWQRCHRSARPHVPGALVASRVSAAAAALHSMRSRELCV